jgi:hypothetical protein
VLAGDVVEGCDGWRRKTLNVADNFADAIHVVDTGFCMQIGNAHFAWFVYPGNLTVGFLLLPVDPVSSKSVHSTGAPDPARNALGRHSERYDFSRI